jgi:hypothetical protein
VLPQSSTHSKEAVCSSEKLEPTYHTTRCHNPEGYVTKKFMQTLNRPNYSLNVMFETCPCMENV